MKTIWKYDLAICTKQVIDMPFGAEVMTVQNQNEKACIWVMVNSDNTIKVPRTFFIHGTGHTIPNDPGRYIGTFQVHKGTLVFHVFEG